MSEPKRHHFVPEWYLRNFANEREQLRVYRRGESGHFTTSVTKAAVQTGLYTVTDKSGAKSQHVEVALADVDGKADQAVRTILAGDFPPNNEDRSALAEAIAFQVVRTREHRQAHEAVADALQKALMEGWTPDYVRQRLKEVGSTATDEAVAAIMDVGENPDQYRIIPSQNDSVRMMLTVADEMAPIVFAKSWVLARCAQPIFITSDHPVVYNRRRTPENALRGLGLGTADEVWYPLDRWHLLVLGPPGALRETVVPIPLKRGRDVNQAITAWSYEWIFQHPEDKAVGDLIPMAPRAVRMMNEQPLFGISVR